MNLRHEIGIDRNRAQGLVEDGVIIAIVVAVAMAGLVLFGSAVATLLSDVSGWV